jgi:hypothetical protein
MLVILRWILMVGKVEGSWNSMCNPGLCVDILLLFPAASLITTQPFPPQTLRPNFNSANSHSQSPRSRTISARYNSSPDPPPTSPARCSSRR